MRASNGRSLLLGISGLRPIGGALVLAGAFLSAMATASAETRALCVHDVPDGQVLRVRGGPGFAAAVIGEFRSGACGVRLVGRCDGVWCEMALNGTAGWVNTRYIGIYELPGTSTAASAPLTGEATMPRRDVQPPPLQVSSRTPPPAIEKTARQGLGFAAKIPRGRIVEQGSSEPAMGACVVRVGKWDTLRIRSGPGVGHDEIGDIPPGACRVEHIGACRGDWCRIAWRGRTGWVNTYYLD